MIIDPKDLEPMPISKFQIGGYFYRKEPNGQYSTCCITENDVADPVRKNELQVLTELYHREGRLFIVRDRPWKPITKIY